MKPGWVTGDATGLAIPANVNALLEGGAEWLTRAFHRFGSLPSGNAVTRIFACERCPGGSTGQKVFLTLEYAQPDPSFDRVLFCKFSRDFDDERRDRQRDEMAGEAQLVALSRGDGFPIRVPRGWFADYEATSGTGLVITERIAFGEGAIEPHRRKCLDYLTMDDPLTWYRATVTALARLAGAHKSGRLGPDIATRFPPDSVTVPADPIRHGPGELAAQLAHTRAFARDCPRLMPDAIRAPAFLDRLEADAFLIVRHEAAIRQFLLSDPALISLNHWNSNIDNCWFWRDGNGLHCGLIDWGRAGQITFGAALWGGLSAAHHDIWDRHLDELLALFLAEYHAHGGPLVALADLKRHLFLHMALMGVARMLAAPEVIRFRMPQCTEASSPRDPMFLPVEADPARNYTSVYAALLKVWEREDFGALVRDLVG